MWHIKERDCEYDLDVIPTIDKDGNSILRYVIKYYTIIDKITCNFRLKENGEIEYENEE